MFHLWYFIMENFHFFIKNQKSKFLILKNYFCDLIFLFILFNIFFSNLNSSVIHFSLKCLNFKRHVLKNIFLTFSEFTQFDLLTAKISSKGIINHQFFEVFELLEKSENSSKMSKMPLFYKPSRHFKNSC